MTTLTVDEYRQRLLGWLEQGDGYAFLTALTPYLNRYPDDEYVRLMGIREFVKLGLISPAREALAAAPPGAEITAQLDQLAQTLSPLPGGIVPWSHARNRFESNLEALAGRRIDVEQLRRAWSDNKRRYELYHDANQIDQVRRLSDDGLWQWYPALRNHAEQDRSEPMPGGSDSPMPGPFLFEGIGLGGYFERVYHETLDTFLGYSCVLYIVETDPALFALTLHLRDWSTLLADERVIIAIGDDWADQISRLWNDHADLPLPAHVVSLATPIKRTGAPAAEMVQEAHAQRERNVLASLETVEVQYAEKGAPYWAHRLDEALSGNAKPLRILAAVSTHTTFLQHSMRDAQRAFRALGYECEVLIEKTPFEVISPLTYHEAIRRLDPDLFFILDHLRPGLLGIVPANLPMLTWDQDQLPHVFTRTNLAAIAPHDFIATCSKSRCIDLGGRPEQFMGAIVPTCPEQFGGAPLTDEEHRRYACDVSYVSHASQTPEAFHKHERAGLTDPGARRLVDAAYEMMPSMLQEHGTAHGAVIASVLSSAMRRCGVARMADELREWMTGWYLWRLGDRMFRHQALGWVATWARNNGRSLRIYGNGWADHPTLAEFAVGPAENGRELLCVYRASRINLQLMPAGFIHQRALDGLAAGGFFLTRRTSHDLKGRVLRKLDQRIRELKLSDTQALLACDDPTLRSMLREFMGVWLDNAESATTDLVDGIHATAESRYPDEVFPRFEEIVFDSAKSFAAAADRYLSDEPARRSLVDEMRDVVLRDFSYQPTMNRFLRAMATYLNGITS